MNVVALSGGVGGAKLAHGLSLARGGDVTVVVNTGDDLEHWGLYVSPDVDTVMYTLAELSHDARGWGLAGETFGALEMMRRYGEAGWFNIGDRDLATHLVRSAALRRGETLTAVTARLSAALGVKARVLPMADAPIRTVIETREHGPLAFQEWLVRRGAPRVAGVRFEGSPPPAPGIVDAIARADVVVIGPSNPYVSIDPILSLPGVRDAVFSRPVIAVSPIVHGAAIKGPLAQMLGDIAGEAPSPAAIARHYRALAGIVLERGDDAPRTRTLATRTVMKTKDDRVRLAEEVLAFAASLRGGASHS